jgi:hypothetical protein
MLAKLRWLHIKDALNILKIILNDILSTKEYTIEGIARYTNTHEDIINELASGLNRKPLAIFFRKIIELHKLVRKDLYQSISNKIINEYFANKII